MNPGGFDYEGWLFQHRIRATGYVADNAHNRFTGLTEDQIINRARYFLRDKLTTALAGSPFTGLVLALSLGDRSLISDEAGDVMIRTGTNHLLAISGLHISLVAALFFFLARKLWCVGGLLPLYMPAPKAAVFAAILAAAGYSLLAGMSIPTQRSLIMVTIIMLGLFSHRRYPLSAVFCAALLLVLLADPFAVLDAGFWLSFAAISIIAYGMSSRVDVDNLWWRWGRTQYLVAIGLLPLLLLFFGQYSLTGLGANYAAIPWVSFLVTPFAIAGTVLMVGLEPLGRLCLELSAAALGLLWPFLEVLAELDHGVWRQASNSVWATGAGIVGAAWLLMPRGMPARWIGLVWMLPLLFPVKTRPVEGDLWFSLLDVGQGLAAVAHTRAHTLVFDTGARFSGNFNTGRAVAVPYLNYYHVDHLDKMVISHGDNDHIGGAEAVLAAYPGTPVLTSVPEKFNPVDAQLCRAGQSWRWDGVDFSILHPDDGAMDSDNNRSCVLMIRAAGGSILLSGDIEAPAEIKLVRKFQKLLAADILVVPHHGSKTSSTPAFISAVAPKLALFPAGYRNRFKFPNKAIIARYAATGAGLYNTAKDGAILITINKPGVSVVRYRTAAGRFWHTKVN
jgi:competence protein ComEC